MLLHLGSSSQTNFIYFQLHFTSWVMNCPWYETTICSLLHGFFFEYYVTTSKHDKYNLMCSIESHEKNHKHVNDQASNGGVRPLP